MILFILNVQAHPGCPGEFPQSRKTVVCVCVCVLQWLWDIVCSRKRECVL